MLDRSLHRTSIRPRFSRGFITIAALSLYAPVWSAEDAPYVISKKEFRKQVKSISLSPLAVAPGLSLTPEFHAFMETESERLLNKTKLDVVPIAPYKELRLSLIHI